MMVRHTKLANVAGEQGLAAQLLIISTLLGCGAMLIWLSIARYMGYNSGMLDLGNMAQAIWSVQRGQPLVSSYGTGTMSRLALHVELIYFLLAPIYALWSDPRLLLIIQAGLFVLGAVPVYRLALRHGLRWPIAYCLIVLYLFYPVAVTSVLFDFHGDTLAMPLLLFMIDLLEQRAWRRYALLVALALSCKVYVALPVALLGLMIWWCYDDRYVATMTIGAAVVYGLVAFLVIRPLFTTPETPIAQSGLHYLSFYFGNVHEVLTTWRPRLFHAAVVFVPGLVLGVAGWRWLLPALLVASGALVSIGPGPAYAYWFHHYALVVPFIVMAAITGAERLMTALPWTTRRTPNRMVTVIVVLTTLTVVSANRKYVDTPLNPHFWNTPGLGRDDQAYGHTARDTVKDQFLAENVPPEVPLAASPLLAAHVTDRATLLATRDLSSGRALPPTVLSAVDAVLADALFDHPSAGGPNSEVPVIANVLRDPSFALVAARDGLLLFRHNVPAEQRLRQQATVELAPPQVDIPQERRFGPNIGLLEAQLSPRGSKQIEATFAWTLTSIAAPQGQYVAISELQGVDGARMVHLPTYALLPVSQWKPGQVVRETFDVQLPDDLAPGRYTWRVGWYDLAQPGSEHTDARTRIPGSQELTVATLDLPPE